MSWVLGYDGDDMYIHQRQKGRRNEWRRASGGYFDRTLQEESNLFHGKLHNFLSFQLISQIKN